MLIIKLINMFLLSFLLFGIPLAESDNVTVVTHSGIVVGSIVFLDDIKLNHFYKIPYAKPPVGDLRFRKTQPIEPWSEPVLANTFPPTCVQYYPYYYPWVDGYYKQSEDCLYLNIFAPAPSESSQDPLKAGMFWIYGGSFSHGSITLGTYFGIEIAAYGDVILVTTNYRLGIFGFLSTGTEDAPGNMGMFDILTSLKWINENIEAFGGDRNRITVIGQGSGSVTAALFTMSPLTRGLFQRIIMESGAPFPLAENSRSNNFELTRRTADAVGCSPQQSTLKSPPTTVVECLKTIDADNLTRVVYSLNPEKMATYLPISGDMFLPIDPMVALKRGLFQDVDVMTGVVQDEGSVELVSTFPDLFGPYGEKDNDPKINKTLGRQLILKLMENVYFKEDIADHYLSGVQERDFKIVRERTYHSKGDLSVVCPTLYFLEAANRFSQRNGVEINTPTSFPKSLAQKEKSKVYFYYFYQYLTGAYNHRFYPWMGTTQFSEINYALGKFVNRRDFLPSDQELSNQMLTMWTDFGKSGVPSSEWRQYSKDDPYIQNLYVKMRGILPPTQSTLEEHLENCEFYRPYLLSPSDK